MTFKNESSTLLFTAVVASGIMRSAASGSGAGFVGDKSDIL